VQGSTLSRDSKGSGMLAEDNPFGVARTECQYLRIVALEFPR